MLSIFEFQNYKIYLKEWIRAQPGKGRGAKSALAESARCQLTYVSRVLKDEGVHFSLEQADSINHYLGHTEDEAKYFLLLVQAARAGTPSLRSHFKQEIDALLNRRLNLKDRFKVRMELTAETQATYYSTWHYAAIHVLVSIGKYQTLDSIARYLEVPKSFAADILGFLVSTGLVEQHADRYSMGKTRIHLGAESPLIARHHSNWRVQALRSLDEIRSPGNDDLHYSSIVSVSEQDIGKIRSALVATLETYNATVSASKEERLQCLAMDFFQVKSG